MDFVNLGPLQIRRMRQCRERALLWERVFRDKSNPLILYHDEEFRKRFTLTRAEAILLVELLRDNLHFEDRRGRPVEPALQVLLALRYYATGSLQTVVGDLHGDHVAFACRNDFIKFPTKENLHRPKQEFYVSAGFPGVRGTIKY